MQITEQEYNQYMSLLVIEIRNLSELHKQTNNAELKQFFQNQQYEYFKKWYELNEKLKQSELSHYTAQKARELAGYLINIANYKELIKIA